MFEYHTEPFLVVSEGSFPVTGKFCTLSVLACARVNAELTCIPSCLFVVDDEMSLPTF